MGTSKNMIGHNNPVAIDVLKGFAKEIRLLMVEKKDLMESVKGINQDISEIYDAAKAKGFDAKILRKTISLLGSLNEEEREIFELYMSGLGDFMNTPLGMAAQKTSSKK